MSGLLKVIHKCLPVIPCDPERETCISLCVKTACALGTTCTTHVSLDILVIMCVFCMLTSRFHIIKLGPFSCFLFIYITTYAFKKNVCLHHFFYLPYPHTSNESSPNELQQLSYCDSLDEGDFSESDFK